MSAEMTAEGHPVRMEDIQEAQGTIHKAKVQVLGGLLKKVSEGPLKALEVEAMVELLTGEGLTEDEKKKDIQEMRDRRGI